MIRPEKLDFWFKNNLNVLFIGKHGVGKTATIKDCFERAGLVLGETFLYFSTPTLDPWVDFVGVPKEIKGEDGTTYLDLVRPKPFAYDKVVAIFCDEYNRASQKIRNAVMELLQFKSINGKQFPHLRVVWAAINPSEGEDSYDVEKLDPAQEDRFHVKVEIPYKPSVEFFIQKFGEKTAQAAVSWWNELPEDQQKLVSPRRLDYALEMDKIGGDIRDVIPHSSNPSKLLSVLEKGPVVDQLHNIFVEGDWEKAKIFLRNENNYVSGIPYIVKNKSWKPFFIPLIPKEKLAVLITEYKDMPYFMCYNMSKVPVFKEIIDEIVKAGMNHKLIRVIEQIKRKIAAKEATPTNTISTSGGFTTNTGPATPFFNTSKSNRTYDSSIAKLMMYSYKHQNERVWGYYTIYNQIPQFMDEGQAVQTLQVLKNMAEHSYTSTITNKWAMFIRIVNHCLMEIYRHRGKPFLDNIKITYQSLFNKIRKAGMEPLLYNP